MFWKLSSNDMTANKPMIRGLGIWAIGFSFLIVETICFGSNWWPESAPEWICDIIGGSICVGGLGVFLVGLFKFIKH
jgi:hypothetical protein